MSSQNFTAIVTGAGGGLGKSIATAFLANGANVAVCDVNKERLAATETEWVAAGYKPENVLTTPTDVTEETSVQKLVAATVAKFGRVDVLVNNAGIMDDFSPVGDCSRELWDRVMGVNLVGPYNTCRAVIAQFEKQTPDQGSPAVGGGGGVIINICSVAARIGHFAGVAYTASKHGLLGLSRNTAFHYADKGIYSVAMVLGGMNTNITDGMAGGINVEAYTRFQKAHTQMDPYKHLVSTEDVAKYVVFLSDKGVAKGTNGSTVDLTNNWPEA